MVGGGDYEVGRVVLVQTGSEAAGVCVECGEEVLGHRERPVSVGLLALWWSILTMMVSAMLLCFQGWSSVVWRPP